MRSLGLESFLYDGDQDIDGNRDPERRIAMMNTTANPVFIARNFLRAPCDHPDFTSNALNEICSTRPYP
ncbi:MAG: hypothetical protein J0I90_03395 [Nitrosospira sp.]|nr:hypothetical protein [Nitrosospira sp.]